MLKHTPLSLCTGETVAVDRLHSYAEPGLFPQRRFRSKHHRDIKTAPFTEQNTCSKAEGNGVIRKLYYLLVSVWDGSNHVRALKRGSGSRST